MRSVLVLAAFLATPLSLAAAAPPTPAEVAHRFYDALGKGDLHTMRSLYAPHAQFNNAAYGALHGRDTTMKMWARALKKPTKMSFELTYADETQAAIRWRSDSKILGKSVNNNGLTSFRVVNGKIVKQYEDYSWWMWAAQWTPSLAMARSPFVHSLFSAGLRLSLHV